MQIFLKQNVGRSKSLRSGRVVDLSPTQIRRICHEVGHKHWYEGAPDLDVLDSVEPVVAEAELIVEEEIVVPEKPKRRRRRTKKVEVSK